MIAGKRGKELLAPVLFKSSTNTLWFNQWLKEHLLRKLKPLSTIILDNAPFHRKEDIFQIVEEAGHQVLFLPPYSPDFNRIEQDQRSGLVSWILNPAHSLTLPLSKKDVFIQLQIPLFMKL